MAKATVRIQFPGGMPVDVEMTDGPRDRLVIKAGTLRIEGNIGAIACADLAAFFARASDRRGLVVERPRRAPAKKARKR